MGDTSKVHFPNSSLQSNTHASSSPYGRLVFDPCAENVSSFVTASQTHDAHKLAVILTFLLVVFHPFFIYSTKNSTNKYVGHKIDLE